MILHILAMEIIRPSAACVLCGSSADVTNFVISNQQISYNDHCVFMHCV